MGLYLITEVEAVKLGALFSGAANFRPDFPTQSKHRRLYCTDIMMVHLDTEKLLRLCFVSDSRYLLFM